MTNITRKILKGGWKMKKIIILFTLVVSFVLFNSIEVQAKDSDFNTNHSASFTSGNEKKTYSFTVKKAGKVTVNITSYNSTLKFGLYTSDDKPIKSLSNFYDATKTNAEKAVVSVYLEPGTYTIKMSNPYSYTEGEYILTGYSFKVIYQDSKTTEQESNNNIETAQVLPLGENYTVGQISWNDARDYYKVVVKKSGYLSFKLLSYISGLEVRLVNKDDRLINQSSVSFSASESNSEITNGGEFVEAGTYYLKVGNPFYLESEGIYKLQANIKPANNNEKEPNNSFERASALANNKVPMTGLISWNDPVDYYKINVPKKTFVSIKMWSYFSDLHVELYDKNLNKIDSESYFSIRGEGTASDVESFDYTLNKGVYYLKFYSGNYFGKYAVSAQMKINPVLKIKSIDDRLKKITGKTEGNSKVRIYVNNKFIKTIQANKQGNYSYVYKKLKANHKVKVSVKNKYGISTSKTIKVLDKTPPKKPSVKTVTTKTTKPTGKVEAYSTVRVYKGKTLIGKATANKKGEYSVKINRQKRGTVLTIYAEDKAKNKSESVEIKVKKA